MAYVDWPSAVPFRSERSGWSYTQGREALATGMDGGDARQRRRPGDGVGTGRWGRGLTAVQMAAFTAFLATIGGGATRFLMPVSLDGQTYEARVVQIIGGAGGIQYGSIGAETMVSFSLLVFPAELTPAAGVLDAFVLYAAFGTALLVSAYTGPCVRVRRSSDNAQADFGFVGRWLDVAAIRAFVGTGSGYFATWYDQSGNGRHATQATTANQPRIIDAGKIELGPGGKPAALWDGVSDRMAIGNALDCARNVGAFTIAAVAEILGASGTHFIGYVPPGSGVTRAGLVYGGTNVVAHGARVDGVAATSVSVARVLSRAHRYIARLRYADAQADIAQDGVVTSGAFGTAGNTNDTASALAPSIGDAQGAGFFNGRLSAFVLARSALDITSLDAALAQVSP